MDTRNTGTTLPNPKTSRQKVKTVESSDSDGDEDNVDDDKEQTVDDKLMHGYKKYWNDATKSQDQQTAWSVSTKNNTAQLSTNSQKTTEVSKKTNVNNKSVNTK